jgi:hypothetical protein
MEEKTPRPQIHLKALNKPDLAPFTALLTPYCCLAPKHLRRLNPELAVLSPTPLSRCDIQTSVVVCPLGDAVCCQTIFGALPISRSTAATKADSGFVHPGHIWMPPPNLQATYREWLPARFDLQPFGSACQHTERHCVSRRNLFKPPVRATIGTAPYRNSYGRVTGLRLDHFPSQARPRGSPDVVWGIQAITRRYGLNYPRNRQSGGSDERSADTNGTGRQAFGKKARLH